MRPDIEKIGVRPGELLMVHAGLRAVGPMIDGPDTLIDALRDAIGADGTLVAYTDWEAAYEDLLDDDGRVPAEWRDEIAPWDRTRTRSARYLGHFSEFVRTTPGALRSDNPGASIAAIGARAGWLTADHPLDFGYGPGSPLAKLVEAGGKVLMIGAPLDTMTLLHHSEHVADVPGKRLRRREMPFPAAEGVTWRMVEEYDTSDPVLDGLNEDYFGTIVEDYLATGQGARGTIGDADAVLVDAAAVHAFGVAWIERWVRERA